MKPVAQVFTLKPEIGMPNGKRKSGIVGCGNHAEVDEVMELYAQWLFGDIVEVRSSNCP